MVEYVPQGTKSGVLKIVRDQQDQITIHTDANWTGDKTTRKATSEGTIQMSSHLTKAKELVSSWSVISKAHEWQAKRFMLIDETKLTLKRRPKSKIEERQNALEGTTQ